MKTTLHRITLMALGALLVCAVGSRAQAPAAESTPATAAFERLKALTGKWEATRDDGRKVYKTFEVTAGGSAVTEKYEEAGRPHMTMFTVFYLEGRDLVLNHYCVAKNQPRMRAEKISASGDDVQFLFTGATNLASTDAGHMYRAVYQFHSGGEFSSAWTYRQGGQDRFTESNRFRRATD
ncbi:MAG TPA: hypothetical protein VGA40_03970 [Candidatus Acidoferrales bacterium]